MGRFWVRVVSVLVLAAVVPACGGGGGGGGGGAGSGTGATGGGGIARGTGAANNVFGGLGGSVNIFSSGDINVGHGAGVVAPILPPVPTFGTVVTSAALTGAAPTFTAANGNAIISANVQLPSVVGTYTINVPIGDLVISGSLTSGDALGTNADALVINVPNGTCYITGSVRTINTDGTLSQDNGGALTITAERIVLTGSIDTRGEGGGTGFTPARNRGGAVILNTTGATAGTDIYLTGSINTSGGNVTNTDCDGGNGGSITVTANGNIYAIGVTVTTKGGSGNNGPLDADANPFGGAGGSLVFTAPAGVWTSGYFDLRGGNTVSTQLAATAHAGGSVSVNTGAASGPAVILGTFLQSGGNATAATGNVTAGSSGSFTIGAQTPTGAPSYVEIPGGVWDRTGGAATGTGTTLTGGAGGAVTVSSRYVTQGSLTIVGGANVSGGAGVTNGGNSGSILIEVGQGDILVNGTQTLTGGAGGATPGNGGTFNINFFNATAGNLTFSGTVTANGGAATVGNAAGGVGGTINAASGGLFPQDANLFLLRSGFNLTANGGAGHGTGNGGAAGTVTVDNEGDIVLSSGTINAIGGASTGGTGGAGGGVFIIADTSLGGSGGNITVQSGNVINASGGAGVTGGNARNDTVAASVDNGWVAPPADVAVALVASAGAAISGNMTFSGSVIAKGGAGTTLGQGGDVLFQAVNGPFVASAAEVLTGTPVGDFRGN